MADDNTKLIIVLEAQARKLQNSLTATNKLINNFAAATERRFDQMNKKNAASFDALGRSMKTSIGGLQNLLGPLVGTLGVREVIRYADAWTNAGNKIAAASQVSGLQARSLDEIKESANGARTGLEEYVDLYSRLLRVAPAVAATELEVAQATDIVAKSLKAGGASAQEQAASLIQLGQAIGSGVLQGDELRSIRENAPLVAQAIAKEFKVSIGELKALGAEGKLTSERVFKALLNAQDDIQAAFDSTRSTIGDAFQRIDNEFTAYIGTAGQATGATAALVDALNFVAEHFKEIAPVVAQFVAILAGAFAGRLILVPIANATVALGVFLTAMRAGTLTAITFSAALGPIALLAGAAAAAYALMAYAEGDAARAAALHSEALSENQNKLDLARDSSDAYRKALQRQIAVQLQAAEAALTEAQAQVEASHQKAAAARLFASVMGAIGGVVGVGSPEEVAARQSEYDTGIIGGAKAALDAEQARITDLRRQLAEIDAIRLTPEGTGDRASGGGATGAGGTKAKADGQWQNAIDGINKRTAAIEAQTAAQAGLNPLVNDYGFAMEKAKAASDLLQAAQDADLAITPELRAQIEMLAIGYAQATVEAGKLTEAQGKAVESMRGWFDVGRSALQGFISDLQAGKTAAEALGNVFQKLGDKFLDMGLDVLFGTGGGDFGAIGEIFGFAKGGIAANGRPKMFANGGVSNTAAVFGEAGPEAAVPLPDGRRIPVDLRMPTGQGAGGGAISVSVSVGVENGELVPLIAQVSGEVAGRQIDQRTPAIVRQVAPGAVSIANRNRTG